MEMALTAPIETPAALVIRLLGEKRIANGCDLTTDAVRKWGKRPGGLIPARHQAQVLKLAAEHKIELSARQVMGLAA